GGGVGGGEAVVGAAGGDGGEGGDGVRRWEAVRVRREELRGNPAAGGGEEEGEGAREDRAGGGRADAGAGVFHLRVAGDLGRADLFADGGRDVLHRAEGGDQGAGGGSGAGEGRGG